MNKTLDASVVICTHNRVVWLARCLRALAGLQFDPSRYEVIVIDNASQDATRETAERLLPSLPNGRYVYEPKLGLSAARNRGIVEAQGRIIAFTDDDCVPEPDWLSGLAAAFEAFPNVGVVAGKVVPEFEVEAPAWLNMQTTGQVLSCLDYSETVCEIPANWVRGASISFARSALDAAGAFREDLGLKGSALLGSEETDLCGRIADQGFRIVYTPQSTVHHHIPRERLEVPYFVQRYHGQGRTAYRQRKQAHRSALWVRQLLAPCDVAFCYLRLLWTRLQLNRLRRRVAAHPTADVFSRLCDYSYQAGYLSEQGRSAFARWFA